MTCLLSSGTQCPNVSLFEANWHPLHFLHSTRCVGVYLFIGCVRINVMCSGPNENEWGAVRHIFACVFASPRGARAHTRPHPHLKLSTTPLHGHSNVTSPRTNTHGSTNPYKLTLVSSTILFLSNIRSPFSRILLYRYYYEGSKQTSFLFRFIFLR